MMAFLSLFCLRCLWRLGGSVARIVWMIFLFLFLRTLLFKQPLTDSRLSPPTTQFSWNATTAEEPSVWNRKLLNGRWDPLLCWSTLLKFMANLAEVIARTKRQLRFTNLELIVPPYEEQLAQICPTGLCFFSLKSSLQWVNLFTRRIRCISSAVRFAVRTTRSYIALWLFASTAKKRRRCTRRSSSQESRGHSAVKVRNPSVATEIIFRLHGCRFYFTPSTFKTFCFFLPRM